MSTRRWTGLVAIVIIVSMTLLVSTSYAAEYNEPDELAQMVEEGELLPVDERLPEDPVVMEPEEVTGTYGGTLYMTGEGEEGIGEAYWMHVEALKRWDRREDEVVPNIAKSVTPEDGGKAWVIELREGMRWSDGEPFTTADVEFWYEDWMMNEDLTPVFPDHWIVDGEKMELEILDETTFRVEFADVYGTFRERITRFHWDEFFRPRHYFEQYHIDYADEDELEEMVEEAGYDEWYELFEYMWDERWESLTADEAPPTLRPYIMKDIPAPGVTILERNPYYWKVDPEGNQLPYIDEIRIDLVADAEMIPVKIMGGEVDYAGMDTLVPYLPLYVQNEEEGDYRTLTYSNVWGSELVFLPNNTHEDPVFNELINDVRFRRALSLGINREEMNEVIMFGLGEPTAATVHPESSYYKEEFAQAYAEYDPDEANRLLDEMGLDERDGDGYRLTPDGERVQFVLEYTTGEGAREQIVELVDEYWGDLGIDLSLSLVDGSLWWSRMDANEQHMSLWHMDRCTDLVFPLEPIWFVPIQAWHGWAIEWCHWYESGGAEGQEPPEEIQKLYDIYEEMQKTVDEEERIELGRELLASQAENVWTIGTIGELPWPVVASNRLRNIPEETLWGYDTYFGTFLDPVQWFLEE